MAKKRTDKSNPSAIKCWRFEVVNADHATRQTWRQLADACRTIVNRWWQLWETRHVASGNVDRLAAFVKAHAAWKRSKVLCGEYDACLKEYHRHSKLKNDEKKRQAFRRYFAQARLPLVDVDRPPPAPKVLKKPARCPVPIMPPEKGGSIYKAIANSPLGKTVHTRSLVLALHDITQRLTGKDTQGVWKLWQAVLLCRQGRPSAEKDQPVPFDKSNAGELRIVSDEKGTVTLEMTVRLAREEVECQRNCSSIEHTVRFIAKKSGAAVARRLASGEYTMRASKIFFKQSCGKWFVSIAYRMPGAEKPAAMDGVAFLRPSKHVPWSFWRAGRRRPWHLGDTGQRIIVERRRLIRKRFRESENVKWGGSSRRGHGRRRAMGPLQILQNRWRNFVTNNNRKWVAEIVRECQAAGIGKLIYFQPTDDMRLTRFLSVAGKVDDRRESTLWDWAQVATELERKCQDAGIECVVRKGRERRGDKQAA